MIALPDYNKEKQAMILEKQKLEEKVTVLKDAIKTEKMKSFILVVLALIFI